MVPSIEQIFKTKRAFNGILAKCHYESFPFAHNKGVFSFIGSDSNNGDNKNGFNVGSMMFAPGANSSFPPSKGVFANDNRPTYSSFAALNKTGTDEDKGC